MEGVLHAMLMTKLRIAAAVMLLTALIAVAGALFTYQTATAQQDNAQKRKDNAQAVDPNTPKRDASETDKEKLQGVWQMESMEGDGMKISKDDLAAVEVEQKRVRIDGNKWITKNGEGKEQRKSFQLNAKKTPKTIDIKALDGTFDQLGIYELEGDDLKVCLCGAATQVRPTEFATKGGSPMMLILYKRVATKQADQPKK
jgi:uncharacterized protein (TIGR03067 family)